MESQAEQLARKILRYLDVEHPSKRVLVGIAGVPGSGKTTLAAAVCSLINETYPASSLNNGPIAVALPMDGFHYTRAQLKAMPNPEEAVHRRGAAFTFDGQGFLELVRKLATPGSGTVYAPSFDHALKDPVDNALAIPESARIVLLEGNYCALNRAPWDQAAALMTELWYIDTPADVAHSRLAKRHLLSGIVADEKEAWERATGTDELNARDIRENLLPVTEIIIQ